MHVGVKMSSILGLRIKSFFIDVAMIHIITIFVYLILLLIDLNPNEKMMNTIRNWMSQFYFFGCLILIPGKTLGMKINKVSFVLLKDNSGVRLWGLVKFYFFQVFFLTIGLFSISLILDNSMKGFLFGALGFIICLSDLIPYFLNKEYVFLHDKLSGVMIIKN